MYQTIGKLCKEHNITIGRLCKEIGVSSSTFTELKSGRTKTLSANNVSKVANYFNVTVDYLLGNEAANKKKPTDNDRLSESKKKLIEFANSVPEDKIDFVLKVMKSILEDD